MRQVEDDSGTFRPAHRGMWTAAVVLVGGLALAACSSSTTGTSSTSTTAASGGGTTTTTGAGGGSNSALKSVVSGITKSEGTTFSATYKTADTQSGQSQIVTFAQSPPKSAVITPSGAFYISGSAVTECQGSGSSATCTSLPASLSGTLSGLTNLFSPGILINNLKGLEAEAASHAAGVSVNTSSATYAGLASTCFTVKGPSQPAAVTYCAATSSGILTYSSTTASTVTLTAFSAHPPASSFSPPAGATVQTLPAGA